MDAKVIINDLRGNGQEVAANLIENLLFKLDILAREIEDMNSEMNALENEVRSLEYDLQSMHEDQAGASI